jgi:hydroxypyruvate isomerase
MPQFAANLTMMFADAPFGDRFARAAQAGFKGVEFLFPYEHAPEDIAGWLEETKLTNVLFNLPPGDWGAGERGLASLPGREAEFRASVARALGYARRLGTPRLHAMAGLLPAGADRARHRATYVENLRYAARELAKEGRTLLIEPINPRDMPGYFLNTQDEAHAICQEVEEANLMVQMDFYHTQIVQGDVTMTLRKHASRVGHVQIAGVPDRHEPDTGELDNGYLMRALDDLGYAGWVGCEYRPRGRTEDGLGWLKAWAS